MLSKGVSAALQHRYFGTARKEWRLKGGTIQGGRKKTPLRLGQGNATYELLLLVRRGCRVESMWRWVESFGGKWEGGGGLRGSKGNRGALGQSRSKQRVICRMASKNRFGSSESLGGGSMGGGGLTGKRREATLTW